MDRRLLFFPILRTRSARKKLVGGSVIVLLAVTAISGCEDDPAAALAERAARSLDPRNGKGSASADPNVANPQSELARRAVQELAELEMDAGIETGRDPPAPGGDLAHDIAAFTTLDACARAHRVADPVVADAVDALGYDTLVRDACRAVQALKAKDGKLCAPIAASTLRQRCEAQVAILVGDPSVCPFAGGGSGVQAREPICLARASRDERLCAAALATDRPTCKALVRGRPEECGGDETCVRQIERYRALLEKPARHAPFPARLHVELAADSGKSEKYDGKFDLDDLAASGAIARPLGDKVRFTIGTPKNHLWPAWNSPNAAPQLFLALTLPTKMPPPSTKETGESPGLLLGPADLSFDLLVPQIGLLGGTLASDQRVLFENASAATGSPLHLTLRTKVSDAGRTFRVAIELETFVRDGTDPRPGAKPR